MENTNYIWPEEFTAKRITILYNYRQNSNTKELLEKVKLWLSETYMLAMRSSCSIVQWTKKYGMYFFKEGVLLINWPFKANIYLYVHQTFAVRAIYTNKKM